MKKRSASSYSLKSLSLYFLQLGALGFGGAFALANIVHTDLVEKKKWITEDEFKQGLAFTEFAPGPLLTQLAMFIGFIKNGIIGAAVAGLSFFCVPALSILVLTIIYLNFSNVMWIKQAFYTITPAVIGIILYAVFSLMKKTIHKKLLWFILVATFSISLFTNSANFYLLLLGGIISLFWYNRKSIKNHSFYGSPLLLLGTSSGVEVFWQLFSFFFIAGLLSFGGGLAILPYIQSGSITLHHWVSSKQFLDGVSIAMITPGPVILISIFIGYIAGKFPGALLATLGIFLPAFLVVITVAPILKKYSNNLYVKNFINGVIAAALGTMVWSTVSLGKVAIIDIPTISVALIAIFFARLKIPNPLIVGLAGMAGIFFLYPH